MNPYASPKATTDRTNAVLRIDGFARNLCPICNASINRWKVGSSIVTRRCHECNSQIWMEYTRVQSVVAMSLPVVLAAALFAMLGWSTLKYFGIFAIVMPILNIYTRILIGHPVAKTASDTLEATRRRSVNL